MIPKGIVATLIASGLMWLTITAEIEARRPSPGDQRTIVNLYGWTQEQVWTVEGCEMTTGYWRD